MHETRDLPARRPMTPDIIARLARHYGYDRRARSRLGPLSPEETASLTEAGFAPDVETAFDHDDVLSRLRRSAARLAPADVTRAYLAGLTASFPRGRQPILSYAFARLLPDHAAQPNTNGICEACGLHSTDTCDPVEEELRLHLGWAWNELPLRYCVDLQSFDTATVPDEAVTSGRAILASLLQFIESQPAETTPGGLEKAIAKAKLLPHEGDKYKRYGILIALAETGILPNPVLPPSWDAFTTPPELWAASRKVKGSPRSDIVLSLAGWRGALGVDWNRAAQLFGVSRTAV